MRLKILSEKIAEAVSKKLGMDSYPANVLPYQKQDKAKEFLDTGEAVAMTGDGELYLRQILAMR